MSDISELEGRIAAAMERIAKGLDAVPAAVDTPAQQDEDAAAEIARLTQELEDERTVTAQLQERVKSLKEKLDERITGMDAAIEEARGSVSAMDAEVQQLRDINAKLRDSNAALRDANAAGLADPELINAALMTELEALRAGRETDAAEMGAVLTQLDAILNEAAKGEGA